MANHNLTPGDYSEYVLILLHQSHLGAFQKCIHPRPTESENLFSQALRMTLVHDQV